MLLTSGMKSWDGNLENECRLNRWNSFVGNFFLKKLIQFGGIGGGLLRFYINKTIVHYERIGTIIKNLRKLGPKSFSNNFCFHLQLPPIFPPSVTANTTKYLYYLSFLRGLKTNIKSWIIFPITLRDKCRYYDVKQKPLIYMSKY